MGSPASNPCHHAADHKHLAQRDDSMSFVALEALLDAMQPVVAWTVSDDSD
jgi:hypothetical protein